MIALVEDEDNSEFLPEEEPEDTQKDALEELETGDVADKAETETSARIGL